MDGTRGDSVRHIRLHDIRHTTATLLKKLGVPPRDVQMILGHSRISTTLELYEHGDMEDSMAAIEQVEALLSRGQNGAESSLLGRHVAQFSLQIEPSGQVVLAQNWPYNSGGTGGPRTPDLVNVNSAWPAE